MDLKLRDNTFNSIALPVAVVDRRLSYSEKCVTSGPLMVSLIANRSVLHVHDNEVATESYVEHPEVKEEYTHLGTDTAIAAVEEISDGDQIHEIESVIEDINNTDIKFHEYEGYCYRVRKGHRKRHFSDEWQNICSGLAGTAPRVLHQTPKKRLFAHRYTRVDLASF